MSVAQLTTGRIDICAHFPPHCHSDMMRVETLLERLYTLLRRTQQMTFYHRIDGDEIDARELSAQQARQQARLLQTIVHAIDEDIPLRHAALRLVAVYLPRRHHLRQRILAIDGHQTRAQRILRRMQGDR